jgi:hypothetical protein
MQRVVILGLLIAFACSSMAKTEEADDRHLPRPSTWTGVGHQSDGSTWDIKLVFGSDSIDIDYPSLECGGIWELVGRDTKTGTLFYKERLRYGHENCHDNGQVALRKKPDGLEYQWSDEEEKITAKAILSRQ